MRAGSKYISKSNTINQNRYYTCNTRIDISGSFRWNRQQGCRYGLIVLRKPPLQHHLPPQILLLKTTKFWRRKKECYKALMKDIKGEKTSVWRKSEGFRRKKFRRVLVEAPSQICIRSKLCNIFEELWSQTYFLSFSLYVRFITVVSRFSCSGQCF